MIQPIFALEWIHACRRNHHHRFRFWYFLLLAGELVLFSFFFSVRQRRFYLGETEAYECAELAYSYLGLLVIQHCLFLLTVLPTLAAGSLADEKVLGSLVGLLTTPLTSFDLIFGKWSAQLVQGLVMTLPVLPVFAFWGLQIGWKSETLAIGILFTLLLSMAIAAVSLLASVWCRTTVAAVVFVYSFLALAVSLLWLVIGRDSINPAFLFRLIQESRKRGEWLIALAPIGLGLLLLTVFCLIFAMLRLRTEFAKQLSRKPGSSKWFARPTVTDSPLRWKERYLTPWSAWFQSATDRNAAYSPRLLMLALVLALPFLLIPDGVYALGPGIMIVTSLVVGVRAAGSITSERERQTWDLLLLTSLEPRQILRGKLWGIFDSVQPLLLTYLIPALALAFWNGFGPVVWTIFWWLLTWPILYFMAALGLECSSRFSNSWRSLFAALASTLLAVSGRMSLLAIVTGVLIYGVLQDALWMVGIVLTWSSVVIIIGMGSVFATVALLFAESENLLVAAGRNLARDRIAQAKL